MKTNDTLLKERTCLSQALEDLTRSLQQIDIELETRARALRVQCGLEQAPTNIQIAWRCVEAQLQPADRVILMEELVRRQATIEQFLFALHRSPSSTISSALALLPSAEAPGEPGFGQGNWRN